MHLLFVALLGLTGPAIAATSGLTEAEVAAALKGEVPVRSDTYVSARGKSAGRGTGAILVERSIAEVWATLARFEDKPEYQPRLNSVQVIEKSATAARVKMEVNATVATVRYTMRYAFDEAAGIIRWKLDDTAKDNGIADAEGEYRLFVIAPARTLVVYRTSVDSGRSVPGFVQKYMTKRSLPELLHAVKNRIESGGKWKKG